jgi:hypothetical protein
MRTKILVALFLAGGMLAVVQAQQGRGMGGFGGGGGPVVLVNDKAVQEELKMAEDQVSKVKDWSKEFKTKSDEIRKDKGVEFGKGGGGGKGGFSPEMMEKMAAANAEISKVAYKELGDLLKKEQVERLKQIDRQNMGINAFSDAEVVSALNLTDSQKTSVKGYVTDFGKDSREIMTEAGFGGGKGGNKGGGDPEKMADARKKIEKARKEYVGKVVDALTDEQKKTWKGLIGDAFDLSKLTPFGRPMQKKD